MGLLAIRRPVNPLWLSRLGEQAGSNERVTAHGRWRWLSDDGIRLGLVNRRLDESPYNRLHDSGQGEYVDCSVLTSKRINYLITDEIESWRPPKEGTIGGEKDSVSRKPYVLKIEDQNSSRAGPRWDQAPVD